MSTIIVYYDHYCMPALNLIFGVEVFMYSKNYVSQFRKMSDQEEEFTAQNIPDASGKRDGVYETITIPVPSEDLPESDQTEDNESEPEDNEPEPEPSGGGHEARSEAQSDQSASNLEINEEEQLLEEVMLPEQALDSPVYSEKHSLTQLDNAIQSTKQQSDDYHLTFLDKIRAVNESLKTSMQQSLATGIT